MVVAFLLAGFALGAVTGGTLLALGQPWWLALAAYAATGAGSLVLLALASLLPARAPRPEAAALRHSEPARVRIGARSPRG